MGFVLLAREFEARRRSIERQVAAIKCHLVNWFIAKHQRALNTFAVNDRKINIDTGDAFNARILQLG
ncbi:MAG: hypothetical protein AAFR01_08990, partial [Pseudomonadota bacterium]